jgi:hypothetical protein
MITRCLVAVLATAMLTGCDFSIFSVEFINDTGRPVELTLCRVEPRCAEPETCSIAKVGGCRMALRDGDTSYLESSSRVDGRTRNRCMRIDASIDKYDRGMWRLSQAGDCPARKPTAPYDSDGGQGGD